METSEPQRRRTGGWLLAAVLAAAAVAGGWWWVTSSDSDEPVASGPATLSYAEVERTDLITFETFDGTLGFTAGDTIPSGASGTLTAIAAEGATVVAGDVLFAIDDEPVTMLFGTVPAWRDLGLTETEQPVLTRLGGTLTGIAAEDAALTQGDVVFTVDGYPVVLLYGTTPAWRTMEDDDIGADVAQLEAALVALGYDPDGTVTVDDEYTVRTEQMVERWQEDLGLAEDDVDGVVGLGEVVFLPADISVAAELIEVGTPLGNGTAVLSFVSEVEPIRGDDVRQLEAGLAALGFDGDGALLVDGLFTEGTRRAVLAWQDAIGAEDDGVVHLGEVVFVPQAVRIGEQAATVGERVTAGAPVLATSSTTTLVTMDLPTDQQDLLALGDQVRVVLPDNTTTTATVTSISAIATTNQNGDASFEVILTLDDAAAAGTLDEAPVEVEIVDESRLDVLAVPVTALLALAEGGYAVEVDAGGGATRLIAVEPGLFADGLVEVITTALSPGDRVVVP